MADDPDWAPKQDMSLLCRVCANQHDYLIPIFEGEGLDHDMPTKMEKHLPVKVRENDKLPTQMCYQCASTIIAWSDLVTNCLEADKKLTRMLRINEKKSAMAAGTTLADDSDHYEDAYDAGGGGGGGDDEDEDFEKEIKQLISDAGVELSGSGTSKQLKLAKPAAKPAARVSSRKRKSEATTPVKRESKKSKSEGAAAATASSSSSGTLALLKPKEENVSGDDRLTCHQCQGTRRTGCKCDLDLFHCSLCSETFTLKRTLREHVKYCQMLKLKNNHQERSGSTQNSSMTKIMKSRVHRNRCNYCEKTLLKKVDWEKHMRENHPGKAVYICAVCNEEFYEFSIYRNHQKNGHRKKQIKKTPVTCEKCGKTYTSIYGLKAHDEAVHLKIRKYTCPYCGLQISFSSNYKAHLRIHTGEKPYVCELCGQQFRESTALKGHKMSHVEVREKTFQCSICSLKFYRRQCLRIHVLGHSDRRPFECNICSSKFRVKCHLTSHKKKVHIDSRPYQCAQCSSAFKTPDALRQHGRRHLK